MSCFDPNAISVVILDHLRHLVSLCAEWKGHLESSAQPPQLGLIPDLLLRKHATPCTSAAEFR